MDRKKDGEQKPDRLSASKENIRSPFIFINKTSRRVKSGGDAENRERAQRLAGWPEGRQKDGDREKKGDRCDRKQRPNLSHQVSGGRRFATISE